MHSKPAYVVAVAAVAALLAACSPDAPTASASSPDTSAYFADLIERAEDAGADELQLAVLRNAAGRGEFTSGDSQQLAQLTADCIEAAGLTATVAPYEPWPGIAASTVTWRRPDNGDPTAADDAIVTDCQAKLYDFGSEATMSQRATIEALDAHLNDERDAVIACLRDRGVETGDDATAQEIRDAVFADMVTTGKQPCSEWY